MYVVTADQRGSRAGTDLIEETLDELSERTPSAAVLRPFTRTAGDEFQGVLGDPAAVVDVSLHLQRLEHWSVGVGVGTGTLGADSRSSRGEAFYRARDAVERAKGRTVPVPLALVAAAADTGDAAEPAIPPTEIEALLHLLASLVRRRSEATWRVLDRLGPETRGTEVAAALGITPQAVSAHRRESLWDTELAARRLVARLLGALPDAAA